MVGMEMKIRYFVFVCREWKDREGNLASKVFVVGL